MSQTNFKLVEGLPYVNEGGKPYIYVLENGNPFRCTVLDRSGDRIRIHFCRYNSRFDTEIDVNSDRIVDISKTANGGIPLSEIDKCGVTQPPSHDVAVIDQADANDSNEESIIDLERCYLEMLPGEPPPPLPPVAAPPPCSKAVFHGIATAAKVHKRVAILREHSKAERHS